MKTLAIFSSYLLGMMMQTYGVDQSAGIDESVLILPINAAYSHCMDASTVVLVSGMVSCVILMAVALIARSLCFRQTTYSSVISIVSVVLGIILGLICTFLVPQFESIYKPFEIHLPVPTIWLLDFRYFLWIPLLLIAISWRPLRLKVARTRYYLLIFLGESLLLSLTMAVLYLPFFTLGKCV